MKSDLEQKLKGIPHSLSPDKTGNRIIIKVKSSDVDKTKKLVGLPNITQVVSEGRKTIKVGEDALLGDGSPHYALVSHREVIATGTKQEMLELSDTQRGSVVQQSLTWVIWLKSQILEYPERKVNLLVVTNTQTYIQMKIQEEQYTD